MSRVLADAFRVVLRLSGFGVVAAAAAWGVTAAFSRVRCSKTALLLVWAVVGVRLVCPWSPPSPVSVFNFRPLAEDVRVVDGGAEAPVVQGVSWNVTAAVGETPAAAAQDAGEDVLGWVWVCGMAAFFGWGVVSYGRLLRRLRFAVRDGDVWLSDSIPSPCVVGFVRPRIYLTFGLCGVPRDCVVEHERQHVRCFDHIWKALGWLVMCVHWFNPLLWAAYAAFLGAIEDACDQRVLRVIGEERRADYGQALLTVGGGRFRFGISPLAFGEGSTKERVKNVLRYKRPLAWITGAALVLCVVVGVCVLTGQADTPAPVGIEGAFGVYRPDGVVHVSGVSSSSPNFVLKQWEGREIVFTRDRFSAGDVCAEQPVYAPLELGDVLRTTEMGKDDEAFQGLFAIDLTEFGSVQGWKVLDHDGAETGLHVFAVDGKLWLGRWVVHDNAAVPYGEYWEILEASRIEGRSAVDVVSFTAQVVASDPDAGTVVVRPEQDVPGVDLLRLEYWEPSLFQAGDRMLVKVRNVKAGQDAVSSGDITAVVPLSRVVAEWRVDLTHDGAAERVFVTDCGPGAGLSYLVVENDQADVLWFGGASTAHVGQNGYYLYQDPADGSFWLLNWLPYMGMGVASYNYRLFSLSAEGTELVRQAGAVGFDMNDVWSAEPGELRRFDQEINGLLDHCVVLLSTNFDTPEGVYWGNADRPVFPIGPFDCGADYFETRQAVAQGSYSFTGEIVSVLEGGVVVRDTSLWTAISEQSYHFFVPAEALDAPLDDPGSPLEGRMVTVTADGPLFLHDWPAAGTHVQARLVGG